MSDIVIRPVKEEDALSLLSIYSYYVTDSAVSFENEVPSIEEFRERIRNISSYYPYIVAEKNGRIAGYAYAAAFKNRAAYDWDVETTIYLDRAMKRCGIGRMLLDKLEEILEAMNITNVNACIASIDEEDEYLTRDSILFHTRMGYSMVGCFHRCGYKFNRWYDMVWMEKLIGEHRKNQPEVVPFPEIRGKFF